MRGAACFGFALALISCGGSTTTGNATEGGAGTSGANGAGGNGYGGAGGGGTGGSGTGGSGQSGSGGTGASGAAGASDVDGGSVDVATTCQQFAERLCATEIKCEPFFAKWQFNGDSARCIEQLDRVCRVSITADGADASATATWFVGLGKLAASGLSSCSFTGSYTPQPPGTRKDTEPCIAGSQCVGGSCTIPVGDVCGSCYTFDKPGDACTVGKCDSDTRCVNGTCVVPQGPGETCDADHPCAQSLTCSGTCQPTPSGGACPTYYECNHSAYGEVCDGTTCQPSTIGQPGDTCASYQSVCAGGMYCFYGTCPALPLPAGSACTDTSQCEAATYCKNGVCTELSNDCP